MIPAFFKCTIIILVPQEYVLTCTNHSLYSKNQMKSYNYKPDLMGTQSEWSKPKSEENTSASLLEMCKPEDTAPAK